MSIIITQSISKRALPIAIVLVGYSGAAISSGIQLIEQGTGGIGSAYAGESARAEDASTLFFNPAGMTRLSGNQSIVALHLIAPSAKFTGQGVFNSQNKVLANTPLSGIGYTGHTDDTSELKVVPNLYYVHDVDSQLKIGFGINAPFGVASQYDRNWAGRYNAVKSEVMTLNFTPSLAYKVNDEFSIGGGISAVYAEAELANAVDFGMLNMLLAGGKLPLKPGTPSSDGYVQVKGDDWTYAYNLGMLWEANRDTRVGLTYRSKTKVNFKGNATFEVPTAALPLTATGAFKNTGDKVSVTLPDTWSLSVYNKFAPQWAVMADVSRTNWHVLDKIVVKFDNPAQADNITPLNWKNTNRYSIGFAYDYDEYWKLRVGAAYDQTPVPSAEFQTPRVPDNNRTWLTLGANYRASDKLSFDVGYARLFFKKASINTEDSYSPSNPAGLHRLQGSYDIDINILSAQVNWKF